MLGKQKNNTLSFTQETADRKFEQDYHDVIKIGWITVLLHKNNNIQTNDEKGIASNTKDSRFGNAIIQSHENLIRLCNVG